MTKIIKRGQSGSTLHNLQCESLVCNRSMLPWENSKGSQGIHVCVQSKTLAITDKMTVSVAETVGDMNEASNLKL